MELREYIKFIEANKVKEVDLTPYELELIPEEIFKFRWIEKLTLGHILNYFEDEFEGKRSCKLTVLQQGLTKLSKLKSLSIAGGIFGSPKPEYRNFELLGELTSLESLYIETSFLDNLDFIEQLSSLRHLQLSHTEIKDYSPLAKASQLKSLTLGDNEISNIDFLKTFKQLEALSLTTNNINSLDAIGNNTKLKRLCVCNNPIENYEAVKRFSELEYFCNGSNHSIELLSNNKKLVEFEPREINQEGINKLSEFENLKTVNIRKFIGETIDVSHLVTVEHLQIYGDFEVVLGLENLINLQSIDISSKKIKKIEIPYLDKLVKIGIPECPIKELSFYPNFSNITELDIAYTKISSLKVLEGVFQLNRLYCDNTLISDLKPILHLINEDFEINFWGDRIPEKLQDYYENSENEGILRYYKEHDR
jgi:hypothetical protein